MEIKQHWSKDPLLNTSFPWHHVKWPFHPHLWLFAFPQQRITWWSSSPVDSETSYWHPEQAVTNSLQSPTRRSQWMSSCGGLGNNCSLSPAIHPRLYLQCSWKEQSNYCKYRKKASIQILWGVPQNIFKCQSSSCNSSADSYFRAMFFCLRDSLAFYCLPLSLYKWFKSYFLCQNHRIKMRLMNVPVLTLIIVIDTFYTECPFPISKYDM